MAGDAGPRGGPMSAIAEFFKVDETELLKNQLVDMVRAYAASHPRQHQKALGPSELGHDCHRRMALYRLPVPRQCAVAQSPR